jgi:N-acetylmuramoyl-L-alanine amidase
MGLYHIVEQGECLAGIARQYGFTDYRKVYDHPQNAQLKQDRPNPNILLPGDQIFIPDKDLKQHSGSTEKRHSFKLDAEKTQLRLVIADTDGNPYGGNRYELKVGAEVFKGTTGSDGLIEQTISADAEAGELTVWWTEGPPPITCTWTLDIGHLDPVEEVSGVQARLNNLGFNSGGVDGILGPKTNSAIQAFQDANGLVVDGIAGPQTQAKLIQLHGC